VAVIVALHHYAARGELHVLVHQFQVGTQVASIERVKDWRASSGGGGRPLTGVAVRRQSARM
jgi:hypothetical protein